MTTNNKNILTIIGSLLIIMITLFSTLFSSPNKKTAELIINLEKAALDRWSKGDTGGFIEQVADEMTYFDPNLETRLDKSSKFKEYMTPINGTFSIYRYELLNPSVQLHGNVGVLTFNLNNYSKEGDITSRWNSTEVYAKINGKWKIIHSHWSYVKPELKASSD